MKKLSFYLITFVTLFSVTDQREGYFKYWQKPPRAILYPCNFGVLPNDGLSDKEGLERVFLECKKYQACEVGLDAGVYDISFASRLMFSGIPIVRLYSELDSTNR